MTAESMSGGLLVSGGSTGGTVYTNISGRHRLARGDMLSPPPYRTYTHLPPVITPIETGIRPALRFNAYPFHAATIPTRNIISFNILCIQPEKLSEPEWHVLMRVL